MRHDAIVDGVRRHTRDSVDHSVLQVADMVRAARWWATLSEGELTAYHPDTEKFDRGGRYFPAHLKVHDVGEPYGTESERWWGWQRRAWQRSDPAVPRWTFTRNRRANQLPVDFELGEEG